MKFEGMFAEAGKKLDELIEKAPEFIKENVEKPIKDALDNIQEIISKNVTTSLYFIEVKGFTKEDIKIEVVDREDGKFLIMKAEKVLGNETKSLTKEFPLDKEVKEYTIELSVVNEIACIGVNKKS